MIARIILVCVFLTVIGLTISFQSFAGVDPATCIGAWLFDDDEADIVDDVSGKGNNGTIKGKPKWDKGQFGMAIDCDGVDDIVNCGNQESLNLGTEDFPVVAWMKCADYTPGSWAGCVISKFDVTVPRHGFLFGVRGELDAGQKEKPLFLMGLGQESGSHLFGTKTINDDAWHHITATVDRDKVAIFYRDGVLESQMNIAGFAKEKEDNGLNLSIGADSVNGWFLKALIDEVAIFKTILSADDINTIISGGLERALGLTAVSPAGKLTTTWASMKI